MQQLRVVFLVSLLTAIGGNVSTLRAHAAETEDTRVRARTLFNEGLDLRKEGKNEAALGK